MLTTTLGDEPWPFFFFFFFFGAAGEARVGGGGAEEEEECVCVCVWGGGGLFAETCDCNKRKMHRHGAADLRDIICHGDDEVMINVLRCQLTY